jgi:hypothetical protein
MDYLQRVQNTVRDTMMDKGMTGDTIMFVLLGLELGFNACDYNDSEERQEKWIRSFLEKELN